MRRVLAYMVIATLGLAAAGVVATRPGEEPKAPVPLPGESVPAGALLHPHEPPGYEPVAERVFHAREEPAWKSMDGPTFRIVRDAGAPRSPPGVGEAVFFKGSEGGRAPAFTEHGLSGRDFTRLYVSLWIRVSGNWQGHDTGVNKVGYVWTHGNPVVFPVLFGRDREPLSPRIHLQDVPGRARNLEPNVTPVVVHRGEWHRWEIALENDAAEGGSVRWWVDGEEVGRYSGIPLGELHQSDAWEIVAWRPVWGGRGDRVEETMRMWVDHIYVSGAR